MWTRYDITDETRYGAIAVKLISLSLIFHRNFVAGILQFQLYRALCQAAGQRYVDDPRRPLHRCDFYRRPDAGRILG